MYVQNMGQVVLQKSPLIIYESFPLLNISL